MKLVIYAAAGALTIALSGCYKEGDYNAAGNDYSAANGDYDGNAAGNGYAQAAPSGSWPEGARIVVEDGVTYRIDPDGARIALGAEDARVEIVDGVRYRIDPGGARVRIDDQGTTIRIPVDGNTSVEVNAN